MILKPNGSNRSGKGTAIINNLIIVVTIIRMIRTIRSTSVVRSAVSANSFTVA